MKDANWVASPFCRTILVFILCAIWTRSISSQKSVLLGSREVFYENFSAGPSDPLWEFSWRQGKDSGSVLEFCVLQFKRVERKGRIRLKIKNYLRNAKVLPIKCPGGWCRPGNPKELILCGWDPGGGGGVLSLVIGNDGSARISWFVKTNEGLISVTWHRAKGTLYLLRADGLLLSAKYPLKKPLRRDDLAVLEWKGHQPWKELGGTFASQLVFRSWKGWPYGEKGALLARRRKTPGFTPRLYFVIGVEGKKCWVKGVWEDPFYHPLEFRSPFPVFGDNGFWVEGGIREKVMVYAFSPEGIVSVFKGKLGKDGKGWIGIHGGLKFGWVYVLKGAPWHLGGNPYVAASPARFLGGPFSFYKGLKAPEILFPRPVFFFMGSDNLEFETKAEAKKGFSWKELDWISLAAPQIVPNKPPLIYLKNGRTFVIPMAVGRLLVGERWKGTYVASLPFPKPPKKAEGMVIWLQSVVSKKGGPIIAASRALGLCVLRAPNYKMEDFNKKYGRIDFFMGWKPPLPVRPRIDEESRRSFKGWMERAGGWTLFKDPGEGLQWLKARFPKADGR